ncbi:MAG: hypothetical protein ACM3QU_01240 [Verrucomicrobiota bacterium]
MSRLLGLAALVAAVAVPAALASGGEPQKRLTKADQAKARAIALRKSDFPAGWVGKPNTNTSQDTPRCSTYNPDQSDLIETGDVDSPTFTRADGSFVSSSVGIFRTRKMATTGYARVARPQLASCFGELFKKGAAPATVQLLQVGPLRFRHLGDRSNAYRLTANVTLQRVTIPVAIDIVTFNRGRVDVAMIFLGIRGPLPSSFEQPLAARVAARAA